MVETCSLRSCLDGIDGTRFRMSPCNVTIPLSLALSPLFRPNPGPPLGTERQGLLRARKRVRGFFAK